MASLYSKRNRPQPETYRYDLPIDVRSRIIHTIGQLADTFESRFDFAEMLGEVGKRILIEYGQFSGPGYEAARMSSDPTIQHFISSDIEMALDFIEMCFQVTGHCGFQRGVDAINAVLQDASIGYELTAFVQREPNKGTFWGRSTNVANFEFPQIIKKDSQFLHAEAMRPTLTLLSDETYAGANGEFLSAHEHYRHARYEECLTDCLKAFESTMKIICDKQNWDYKDADTAKVLIKICLDNGLVETFSQQQLTSLRTLLESGIPTVRNKQGGHGQGSQLRQVPPYLARYALHLTAATILLLVESASAR